MIKPAASAFITQFGEEGYYLAPGILDAGAAARFVELIKETRPFDSSLFMSEEEFNAGPKSHQNTNPNPGRNILEALDNEVGFVEKSPALKALAGELLGDDFRWFYRKVVCRVPRSAMPDWVLKGIKNGPTTTLGAYIKPQYRDIAYYHDNELHQDAMDYARMPAEIKEHRLITLYVYLSDVTAQDAPTCVMPKTHKFGANPFPYDIRQNADGAWVYTDARGKSMNTTVKEFPTGIGSVLMWHSCLLHGARPIADGHWRFGIRYMLACGKNSPSSALDAINEEIDGPVVLEKDYTSGSKAMVDGFLVLPQSDFARTYFADKA